MNGTLGRDKVWNDHIWGEIDKAVRDETGRIRVAQKVFPSIVVNNLQPILANTLAAPAPAAVPAPAAAPAPAPLRTGDDVFRPFIEMSIRFVVTQAQVETEESMHVGMGLAKFAATTLAAAEDNFLFNAKARSFSKTGVDITNTSAIPDGFVETAKNVTEPAKADIFEALVKGIGDLNGKNQPGPYALFLPPKQYANTFQPIRRGSSVTNAQRIIPLVPAGFYPVNSLSDDVGILVSLGGEPVTIYLGIEATTAFGFVNGRGEYNFRVFERIQLVVRDSTAFVTLDFTK